MDTAIHRLSEDKDLVHSFLVPPNLRNITFALSGTVQPTAAAKPRTLRHEQTFSLNKQLSTCACARVLYASAAALPASQPRSQLPRTLPSTAKAPMATNWCLLGARASRWCACVCGGVTLCSTLTVPPVRSPTFV